MPADTPEIQDAPRELLWLACRLRPDWDREETWQAIHAAHAAGWPFARTVRETVRLLLDGSEPRDLRAAAGKPSRAASGQPLTAEEREELRGHALAAMAAATEKIFGGDRRNPAPEPRAGDP